MSPVPIPHHLESPATARWQALAEDPAVAPLDPGLAEEGPRVFAASEFVAQACSRHPGMLGELAASGDLVRGCGPEELGDRVRQALADLPDDDDALLGALRALRRREMVRIAWRDISGRAPLEETMADLSALADGVLDATLGVLHRRLAATYGEPCGADGEPQSLVVLALGKLGAQELNFSSDIDLIFAIPDTGTTRGGRRERTSEEFFIRLGQNLIHALNHITEDGLVFRVDMRLRPFGSAGPLVITFDAMEAYYQQHGRDWERYAWIKARVAAGDRAAGERLLADLSPFVYRRYLDYGAFESLREMKALVAKEVSRKGMEENIKLGPGGIREVEFIAQTFQLIRGGRDIHLRERRVERVLTLLGEEGLLPAATVYELVAAYRFLRNTEHRLQQLHDQQTQSLPEDPEERDRLAFGLGFTDWENLMEMLDHHRARVQAHFSQVFAVPREMAAERDEDALELVWRGSLAGEGAREALARAGFRDPARAEERIQALRDTYGLRVMSATGRQRLDRLMPHVLQSLAETPEGESALERVFALLEAIARRSVYLALLAEHPEALGQVVRLFAASPWIAQHITRFPVTLDELLDPRTLYAPPDRAGLEGELDALLARTDTSDEEEELNILRTFKQTHVLRVAAADIAAALPLMRVSDHLSDIAEVLLARALELAWRDMTGRYGRPPVARGDPGRKGFLIIAYGKLGGLELGYGSDLDVVFLHDAGSLDETTDGPRATDVSTFYARIGKRLVHVLTAPTAAGPLYELDLRLRPSGRSGLLVTTLDAFAEYQERQAWTWEHQALVRARPVAGDPELWERFRAIRARVLARPRDPATLRAEVRDMRRRMREAHGTPDDESFHLKQDTGGIADIEFIVQYMVLRWAGDHPQLFEYTDNIRILEAAGRAGILAGADVRLLMDAYRAYRARVHRLALQDQPAVVPPGEFAELRQRVAAVWRRELETE